MVVFKQYTDDRGRQADAHTKQKKCLCYTCSVMLLLKVQNKRKSTGKKYIFHNTTSILHTKIERVSKLFTYNDSMCT
jgi:hypothetical protein